MPATAIRKADFCWLQGWGQREVYLMLLFPLGHAALALLVKCAEPLELMKYQGSTGNL